MKRGFSLEVEVVFGVEVPDVEVGVVGPEGADFSPGQVGRGGLSWEVPFFLARTPTILSMFSCINLVVFVVTSKALPDIVCTRFILPFVLSENTTGFSRGAAFEI